MDIAGDVGGILLWPLSGLGYSDRQPVHVLAQSHIGKKFGRVEVYRRSKTYYMGKSDDGVFTPHFYPKASFQFNIVKEVIVPYFGVDGFLESNNFRNTVEENPYVVPGLSLRPTSHKLIGYAGFEGTVLRCCGL